MEPIVVKRRDYRTTEMGTRNLSSEIVLILSNKIKRDESTIKKDIYLLHRKFSKLPINAVAQIYALQRGFSVLKKLNRDEKNSLPNLDLEKPIKVVQKEPKATSKRKLIEFVTYDTEDPFIRAHIIETNKTYTYGCYTAAFILCRKIIENLLTDIVRKKYPSTKKENIDLYFDTSRGRTKDFSEILNNLRKHAKEFEPDKTQLERILNKANQFKDDANDKTHSWFHIVRSKKELDETNVQDIIDMINNLEKKHFT